MPGPDGLSGPDLYDPRGKLAADSSGDHLIALLPDPVDEDTKIYAASASGEFAHWELLATVPSTSTDPLSDQNRLRDEDVLGVFVRQAGPFPDRELQAWNFALEFQVIAE